MAKNDCIHYNKSNGCCLKHSKISRDGSPWQPCVESPCLDYVAGNRDIIEMANAEVVSLENFFESLKDSKAYFTISDLYKRIAEEMDATILCILEKYGCVGDPEKLIEVVKSGKIHYDNGYRDGRIAAAREILEKIKETILDYQYDEEREYIRCKIKTKAQYNIATARFRAINGACILVLRTLAALKKRYIGEQEDKHREGEQ